MKRNKEHIMKTMKFVMAAVTCILFLIPENIHAIPAFARRYGFSCTTCHISIPKLKAYGEDFAGNGFQLPDGEESPRAYKDTGDDDLLLQRELPLGIRFDAFGMFQSNHKDPTTNENMYTDIQTPYGLKILSGGHIAKNIGYYFYFYFSERGEVAGVEDAIVHFNNIKGTDLDIVVGQFQVSDPLFKRELRLTYEDYQIYKTKVGESRTDLTYDRGIMMTYGLPSGTDFVFELVNGNGKEEAGADRLFDMDNWKNSFLKINQSFEYFRLGMFGYFGSETLWGRDNDFNMWGPDATIGTEKFEVNLQWMRRTDKNPLSMADPFIDVNTDGIIAEAVYIPNPKKPKWLGTLLYNRVDSDLPEYDYESVAGNLSYMHKTNIRFMLETIFDIKEDNTKILFGFVSGF